MTVVSGVIPYQYAGDYPFRVDRNISTGLSGILFEQAMAVHAAEIHRFGGSFDDPFTYYKYTNPFSSETLFNPRPDGSNLDGTIDGIPAGAFYVDYILDLRAGFSTVFSFASADLGGSFSTFTKDWLLWVGSISGTKGNFTRSQTNINVGPILSTDPNEIGASGAIYDVDLREVTYQPYSRIARGATASLRSTSIPLSPLFPTFIDTAGNFVRLNSREQNLSLSAGGYTRTTADFQAAQMILDGDMFFDDTDFCILPGTATRTNLEGVISHNALTLLSRPGRARIGNSDNFNDLLATALLSPPSLPEGAYAVGAINNLATHPYLVVPSGTLSFKPSIPYNGDECGSGLFVFNRSLWVQDDELTFSSGLRLVNPYDKSLCWFRQADQSNHIDGGGVNFSWSRQTVTPSLTDDGAEYLKFGITNDTGSTVDNKLAVFRYSQSTLDLVAVDEYTQDWTVFGASTSVLDSITSTSFDGSTYYMVGQAIGVFRNIFIFDASFTLMDSKSYVSGAGGGGWIAHGVLTGGVFWQTSVLNKIRELIIDPDPGNDTVTDTGIDYQIDVTAPGWPGTSSQSIFKIGQMKVLSGETHFNDGTWCIVETTTGLIYFIRIQINGTSLEPLEGFLISGLSASVITTKFGYTFVTGGYT